MVIHSSSHESSACLHGCLVDTLSCGVLHTSLVMMVWHHMTGIVIRVNHLHHHERNQKQNSSRSQFWTFLIHECFAGGGFSRFREEAYCWLPRFGVPVPNSPPSTFLFVHLLGRPSATGDGVRWGEGNLSFCSNLFS